MNWTDTERERVAMALEMEGHELTAFVVREMPTWLLNRPRVVATIESKTGKPIRAFKDEP